MEQNLDKYIDKMRILIYKTIPFISIEEIVLLYKIEILQELILEYSFSYGRIDILEMAKNKGWKPSKCFIASQLNIPNGLGKFDNNLFFSIDWLYQNKFITSIPPVFINTKLK